MVIASFHANQVALSRLLMTTRRSNYHPLPLLVRQSNVMIDSLYGSLSLPFCTIVSVHNAHQTVPLCLGLGRTSHDFATPTRRTHRRFSTRFSREISIVARVHYHHGGIISIKSSSIIIDGKSIVRTFNNHRSTSVSHGSSNTEPSIMLDVEDYSTKSTRARVSLSILCMLD